VADDIVRITASTLSSGGVYALVALGIAVLYSILRLVNFAHGELMVIGAYAMSVLSVSGVPFVVVAIAAPLAAMATALVLERLVFRPARGAPDTTLLLMSFTVSVILQNVLLFSFGGTPREIDFPGWMESSFSVGTAQVAWLDVATFGTVVVVLIALTLVLHRTVIGIALRAAAEDFEATRLMGIRANRVVVAAFAVSGAVAGIAAVFWFAKAGVIGPNEGTAPLLSGFIAAIIGGLGTLTGAVLGGFLLAFVEALFQTFLSGTYLPYANAFVFLVVIAVLLVRPGGLLNRDVVRV